MEPLLARYDFSEQLEAQIEANLSARLETSISYSLAEIRRISNLEHRFFPARYALGETTGERLRALCRLSRCSLKSASEIKSHRRVIGPIIVALKRLTWPFVRAQLKGTFEAQEEFNTLLIETVAKELPRDETLH